MGIAQNIEALKKRIAEAAKRARREPLDITLVCVTKGVGLKEVEEAIDAGVTDIGENRVQEASLKEQKVEGHGSAGLRDPATGWVPRGSRITWHLIGHLQTNKVRKAVELFDVIHSIDSLRLIEEINREAERQEKSIDIFIQVNCSGEPTKFGIALGGLGALVKEASKFQNVHLKGLMTIAPIVNVPEDARPYFRMLRELRDELIEAGPVPLSLSMGMSQDFEVAIEEGADLVRIGGLIFKK